MLTKEKWLEKYGFSPEGLTYVIYGDDTYAIKDWLKEQGCKFNPTLKWHSPHPISLPDGYGFFKDDANKLVDKKIALAQGPSLSEYVGEVGERLRNLTAIYKSTRGFMGNYGWTNIHTFQCGEDILVWFTSAECSLERGTVVDLTGTVKKHEEFRGVKTTQLSRCKIKEVA